MSSNCLICFPRHVGVWFWGGLFFKVLTFIWRLLPAWNSLDPKLSFRHQPWSQCRMDGYELLVRAIRKREEAQRNNMRTERGDSITDFTGIKMIITVYYEQLYANRFYNFDEMDKFLGNVQVGEIFELGLQWAKPLKCQTHRALLGSDSAPQWHLTLLSAPPQHLPLLAPFKPLSLSSLVLNLQYPLVSLPALFLSTFVWTKYKWGFSYHLYADGAQICSPNCFAKLWMG